MVRDLAGGHGGRWYTGRGCWVAGRLQQRPSPATDQSPPHPIDTRVLKFGDEVAKALGKPVMVSETGYPSGPSVLGYSPDRQSEYVEGSTRQAYSLDGVTGIGIWRYVDTSWRSFPPQENHFGLFDNRGSPKPAWAAYLRVIKELK